MVAAAVMFLLKFIIISAVGNVVFRLVANPRKYFG